LDTQISARGFIEKGLFVQSTYSVVSVCCCTAEKGVILTCGRPLGLGWTVVCGGSARGMKPRFVLYKVITMFVSSNFLLVPVDWSIVSEL
jgi:hypothetical protein